MMAFFCHVTCLYLLLPQHNVAQREIHDVIGDLLLIALLRTQNIIYAFNNAETIFNDMAESMVVKNSVLRAA